MNGNRKSKDAIRVESEGKLKPVPIHASVCLCKNNFDYFNWQNVRHLRSRDCDSEIRTETLSGCEDRITTVEFLGVTSYTNIKTLLNRCPNLKSLTLTNVLLSHYDTDYKKFYIIETNDLRNLKFSGSNKLTKDEMHILDFFFRRVRFAALKSVNFEYNGQKRPDDKKKSKQTLRNNFTKASVNGTSVINFLTQNRLTLKSLQVTRFGVPLHNNKYDNLNEPVPEHMKLQLSVFECDTGNLGFEKILNNQNHLEILTCSSKKATSACSVDAIANAIRRCGDTLKEIRILQTISPNTEFNKEDIIQHDCAMYKFCNKLEYLHLHVSIPEQLFHAESTTSDARPGAILNLRFLPLSISHLILQFDFISKHGVELFISRIPKMINLKFLVFRGNFSSPFKVKSSWIILLLNHPNIDIFEFSNCKIEDMENIKDVVNSRPELASCLTVTSDGCLFWREIIPEEAVKQRQSVL
ncbi:unnamed protein product [Allacma fusca]|uniref:Uncharacterized protein n=1 Tax=Allacma fusca TaxID=39272 RepID=A0A8J2L003_9HEXA|nr:unnamed protein product [Allacma fusca]